MGSTYVLLWLLLPADVSSAVQDTGFPRVHGFVYDIGEGMLKMLDVNLDKMIEQ